jgi:hypothetical protein
MKAKNGKNIVIKGKDWTIKALAIGLPGKDVAIDIKMPKGMYTHESVQAEGKRLKNLIQEWFEDSKILDPKHIVINVSVPDSYYQRSGEHQMQPIIYIACYTRRLIQMGMGEDGFYKTFGPEVERLREALMLEI